MNKALSFRFISEMWYSQLKPTHSNNRMINPTIRKVMFILKLFYKSVECQLNGHFGGYSLWCS